MPSLAQRLLDRVGRLRLQAESSGPATTPCAPISASQVRPSSSALALLITTTAAAPSEICEAEPAVMVPSLANAGRSLASALDGGVAAHALVVAEHDRVALALRDRDRGDLVVEDAVLLRGGRALVRAGGERVLLLAGRGRSCALYVLGRLAHRRCWSNASVRPS